MPSLTQASCKCRRGSSRRFVAPRTALPWHVATRSHPPSAPSWSLRLLDQRVELRYLVWRTLLRLKRLSRVHSLFLRLSGRLAITLSTSSTNQRHYVKAAISCIRMQPGYHWQFQGVRAQRTPVRVVWSVGRSPKRAPLRMSSSLVANEPPRSARFVAVIRLAQSVQGVT